MVTTEATVGGLSRASLLEARKLSQITLGMKAMAGVRT
jgi:hypothetical protein